MSRYTYLSGTLPSSWVIVLTLTYDNENGENYRLDRHQQPVVVADLISPALVQGAFAGWW